MGNRFGRTDMSYKFKIMILLFWSMIVVIYAPIEHDNELEVHYIHGQYALDMDNPYEVVGFSDYVFVAKVEEKIRTLYEYSDIDYRLHIYRMSGWPNTHYSIKVVENIKGDIVKDIPITLEQFGGISLDRKYIMLMENDTFLEPETYYVIVANSQKDGGLLLNSPNGYRQLEISNENEIMSSKEFKEFVDYYENEIKYERERYDSNYIRK
mgnify:CR=1 FL=1